MHEYDKAYYFSRFHCSLTLDIISLFGASGEICVHLVDNHVLSNRFGEGGSSIFQLLLSLVFIFLFVTPTIFGRIGLGRSL